MNLFTDNQNSISWIETNLGEYILFREFKVLLNLLNNYHKDIRILYNYLVISEPEFLVNLNKWFNLFYKDQYIKQFMLCNILSNSLGLEKDNLFSNFKDHLVIAQQNKLPIDNNIIDLVFLPHTLESLQDYFVNLMEVYRILKPGGRIMITGFNKNILGWLFRKFISNKLNLIFFNNKHFTINQVKYWLMYLGFDEIKVEYECYNLLINHKFFLKCFAWLEKIGKFFPFISGNIYIISARKKVTTLTSILSREYDEIILDNNLAKNLLDS